MVAPTLPIYLSVKTENGLAVGAVIDLTGKRFHRWCVEGLSHQNGKMLYWMCVCDCGTRRAVFGADLKRGGSRSCGCLAREERAKRNTKHGSSRHPLYSIWQGIHQRCENPNDTGFTLYGGRGVRVCERWAEFEAFYADMGDGWAKGLTLERLDVNGDYAQDNCCLATPKQQANNRRTNRYINTPDGRMTVVQAAERVGISDRTVFSRIRYGWPEERLLDPVRPHAPRRSKANNQHGA